mmetsp:Transcript_6876/g.20973  ORF Transcript_6876/g.20973 Transcript_6876/m.20973 type:complete len:299 (-) Transcript_6876:3394-4290(-)
MPPHLLRLVHYGVFPRQGPPLRPTRHHNKRRILRRTLNIRQEEAVLPDCSPCSQHKLATVVHLPLLLSHGPICPHISTTTPQQRTVPPQLPSHPPVPRPAPRRRVVSRPLQTHSLLRTWRFSISNSNANTTNNTTNNTSTNTNNNSTRITYTIRHTLASCLLRHRMRPTQHRHPPLLLARTQCAPSPPLCRPLRTTPRLLLHLRCLVRIPSVASASSHFHRGQCSAQVPSRCLVRPPRPPQTHSSHHRFVHSSRPTIWTPPVHLDPPPPPLRQLCSPPPPAAHPLSHPRSSSCSLLPP